VSTFERFLVILDRLGGPLPIALAAVGSAVSYYVAAPSPEALGTEMVVRFAGFWGAGVLVVLGWRGTSERRSRRRYKRKLFARVSSATEDELVVLCRVSSARGGVSSLPPNDPVVRRLVDDRVLRVMTGNDWLQPGSTLYGVDDRVRPLIDTRCRRRE
jgi:hypothetical protein